MREPSDGDPLESAYNILIAAGTWSYGKESDLGVVAQEWLDTGFSPQDIHDWINTGRVFYASVAKQLKRAGLDPDMAGLQPQTLGKPRTRNDTIGYAVSNKTLTVNAAKAMTEPIRSSQRSRWPE
jgi:hypothetical protein